MQLLCVTALLLSAVAAGRGYNEQLVTQAAGYGDGGSGSGDYPLWTDETPPWLPDEPTERPGDGNPWEPMNGTDHQPVPGVSPGPSQHFGRPQGPSRGPWWSSRRNSSKVFSPIFKVDNVTFQNVSGVTLKEGENIFLMPKPGGRGHHHHHHHHHRHGGRVRRHHMGGRHGPVELGQYVKLIYNSTEPDKVSIEYGVLKYVPDATPGVTPGPSSHFGRPQRPSRGHWQPNRRNPGSKVFSPIFKVDNVTFQNVTGVTLKEGENIFLMPKLGGRGHPHHRHGGRGHHHMGGGHGPPESVQYVKLIYNATEPDKVSIEYGDLKHVKLGEMAGVEDSPEDYY